MKKGMKDKVEGSFHEAKGLVKEVAGKLTGQMDLEIAGVTEKAAGKVLKQVGAAETLLGQ